MTNENIVKMEPMLQLINSNFVALAIEEVQENHFLYKLLDDIIDKMRVQNALFNKLFQKKFFGGSFWDRLKVGRPDEYDVHVQCKLHNFKCKLVPSDQPGWVNLKFEKQSNPHKKKNRRNQKPYYGIPGFHVLVNKDGYLDTEKVMLWFHQTLARVLKGKRSNRKRVCSITIGQQQFKMSVRRHGPAFTFAINTDSETNNLVHVDFVPAFLFEGWQFPDFGFRANPTTKEETFIVAKPVKGDIGTRYWQLSFQNQERELLADRGNLKPALRLLKKMRDKFNHYCIASFYLKNLILWELETRPEGFWEQPLSVVFIEVLQSYKNALENNSLPFYWYNGKKYNLFDSLSANQTKMISTKIGEVIIAMKKSPSDKKLAKFFLTRREYALFRSW
ncbi:unnamed protein product [Phyllotreta striolata]|uniref:Uncharacterized protein n=1 Tax=Phyllotreta striolata TaxID=444603 RepID=A0A9P0GT99_PHYSR|nr:unnamed protein product [Phyllotreta striolata]